MIVYGYAKNYLRTTDNTYSLQVRIPSIHGPYNQSDSNGKTIRNYIKDEDLPWYQSLVLPHIPSDGEVVALLNTNNSDTNTDFLVIGLTGASYNSEIK